MTNAGRRRTCAHDAISATSDSDLRDKHPMTRPPSYIRRTHMDKQHDSCGHPRTEPTIVYPKRSSDPFQAQNWSAQADAPSPGRPTA